MLATFSDDNFSRFRNRFEKFWNSKGNVTLEKVKTYVSFLVKLFWSFANVTILKNVFFRQQFCHLGNVWSWKMFWTEKREKVSLKYCNHYWKCEIIKEFSCWKILVSEKINFDRMSWELNESGRNCLPGPWGEHRRKQAKFLLLIFHLCVLYFMR